MHKIITALAVVALSLSAAAQVPPSAYLDAARLDQALRDLTNLAGAKRAELIEFGRSREGHPLLALRIGQLDRPIDSVGLPPGLAARAGRRPSVLMVSGLESDALVGSSVLLGLIRERLSLTAEAFESTFSHHDLIIIPRVDFDGSQRFFADAARHDLPGSATPIDQDRDGRPLDEDQPTDLDGDGLILEMRWPHPEGELVEDEDDPRLLVVAEDDRRGFYRRQVEAMDTDGDGNLGEDPAVGVQLDRNFPHAFAEHDIPSGTHPMSEPETRALARFVLDRPEIAIVITYGVHDNLARIPDAMKGTPSRRSPRTAPSKEDREILVKASELLKAEGQVFEAREKAAPGSFHDWAHYHLGLPSFAICLFEAVAPKKKSGKKSAEAPTSKPSDDSETAADSTVDDLVLAAARAAHADGFSEWKAFAHPSLGSVEIGGFRPFLRRNPPAEVISELRHRQSRFLAALEALLPRVGFDNLEIEALGVGLYRVEVNVLNDGGLPTTTKQGTACRAPLPLQLVLDWPRSKILQGEARSNLSPLRASSGRHRARWLINAASGERVKIHIAAPHAAPTTLEVVLP